MFSKQKKIRKHQGLKRALRVCGMEFEGRQHSALVDAKNAVRLVCGGHLLVNEEEIGIFSKR